MTPAEAINPIKALPPEEQEKVICFVSKIAAQKPGQAIDQPIDQQAFEAAAPEVFKGQGELFVKLAS
jgi:hypothetical protein